MMLPLAARHCLLEIHFEPKHQHHNHYAEAILNSCASSRVAVTASISNKYSMKIILCQGQTTTLDASIPIWSIYGHQEEKLLKLL
jgi:hypothetical protein